MTGPDPLLQGTAVRKGLSRIRAAIRALAAFLLFLLALPPGLGAQSPAEKDFLALFFTREELRVVSTTRSLASISRVAENVTVVTAREILAMNAHTLADVLRNVPGLQLGLAIASPGVSSLPRIQGSEIRHVAVLLNGVPLNNLPDNVFDLGLMPAQVISRVEVVKGPASSAWGSALGGVINVITKSPPAEGGTALTLSGSYGEERTGDARAEAAGGLGALGYYLFAGRLQSDGLRPGFDAESTHLVARLSYGVTAGTDLELFVMYTKADRGDGEYEEFDEDYNLRDENLFSSLALRAAPADGVGLDLSLWAVRRDEGFALDQLSDGAEIFGSRAESQRRGARAALSWKGGRHSLVAGADYEAGTLDVDSLPADVDEDSWALFANDTVVLGDFSLTPGIRYDSTRLGEGVVSPSLGVTYGLGESTLLRGFVARGFTSPSRSQKEADNEFFAYRANGDLTLEKVTSYQLGLETGVVPGLWLKLSAFRHDAEDIIVGEDVDDPVFVFTLVNAEEQRRQGVEAEFRTLPFHGLSLRGGAVFIDAEDRSTGEELLDVPKRTFDLKLLYESAAAGLKALLTGHYIDWNSPPEYNADDDDVVVDLSVTKGLALREGLAVDLFFNVWNLFDGAQYGVDIYRNAGRWFEGGVRCSF